MVSVEDMYLLILTLKTKNSKKGKNVMKLLSILLTLAACVLFYITCERISLKPSKQKIIGTAIFSVLMFSMAYAWFRHIL